MDNNQAKGPCPSLSEADCPGSKSFGKWLSGAGNGTSVWAKIMTAISFALVQLLAIVVFAFSPQTAAAQSIPTTNRGWLGLDSGTQPPAGIYVTTFLWTYNYDTLMTNDGTTIGGRGVANVEQVVPAFAFTYVSEGKLLGGNYSASFVLPLANTAIDLPRLTKSTDWGASDMYFQPFQLGWHLKHANLLAGYAIYLPTGRFTAGSLNNTGLGQVSNEFSFGFTAYPLENKRIHLATLTQYYIESGKMDSAQKTGQSLQLQGGAGVAFKDGLINGGMAYYTQWKITEDRVPLPISRSSRQKQVPGLRPGIQHRFANQRKDAGVREIQVPLRNREPRRHSRQHTFFRYNCCASYQTLGGS